MALMMVTIDINPINLISPVYSWSDINLSIANRINLAPGVYYLQINDNNCFVRDTFNISQPLDITQDIDNNYLIIQVLIFHVRMVMMVGLVLQHYRLVTFLTVLLGQGQTVIFQIIKIFQIYLKVYIV